MAAANLPTPYAQTFHEITLDLLRRRDVDELLGRIVEQSTHLLSASYGEILLLDGDALVMRAHTPNPPFPVGERSLRNKTMLAWQAVDTQEPVRVDDYTAWAGRTALYEGVPLTAAADFPILNGEACIGVLAVARTTPNHPFSPEDERWGTQFSQLVALVLVNAQLHATAAQQLAERTHAERALRQREAILTAVAFGSEQLLKSPTWETPLPAILAKLGQAAEASRVYLFRKHLAPDGQTTVVSQRYEWVAEGIAPQIDNPILQNTPIAGLLPRWIAHFEQGEMISGLVRQFPPDEQPLLTAQQIIALLAIPIMVDEVWWGFLGFDECVGERVWTSAEIEALTIATHHLGAAVARQQQQEALAHTAANLAQAQAIGRMGNWEWDVSSQESTWSDEHYELFGLTPGTVQPTRELFRQAIHPDDQQLAEITMQQAIAGEPYNLQYRIFLPDGEMRYLHSWARVVTDKAGKPIRFIGVVQDITERKQVEETIEQYIVELKKLMAEQTIILEHTAAAIFLQRKGQVVWGNSAAERLTGYTQEEARLLSAPAFHVSPEAHAAFYDLVAKQFDQGLTVTTEIQLRRKDGTLCWVEIIGKAINPPYSFADGILWIMHDIEERKKAEVERQAYAEQLALARDQALQASDYKSQLLSKVGHELRTPLGGILGYAELLQDELAEESKPHRGRFIHQIVRSARHLDSLINDLLDQAQIEQGTLKIVPAPFFLPNMVSFLDGILGPLAIQKGLEFALELAPTLPVVLLGDERRIRQIIINLTNNAIKFTVTGHVRVLLQPAPPDGWQIVVHDTGIGIPAEAQPKIFESFWQVTPQEQRGYGLGLSIVSHLVRLMGGRVNLQSELGRGSTFTVSLPLVLPV